MYRLRVLGGFSLEGPSGTATPRLPKRRAEAVLAVLAVCGDLGCTRERLVALLWPESDEARSRHGLRDALHALRRVLGRSAVPSSGHLLRLDPAVVVTDIHSFTRALSAGRHADAVEAYGGPLLEGFHVDDAPEYEHWLDAERTRLAREYAEVLKHLATVAERAGTWGEATRWWARAVEHDPLNSQLVLRHVRALAAIGDRANAIRVADLHARLLREELDLEPDREVIAKIERIRQGGAPTPPALRLRTPERPPVRPLVADESPPLRSPEQPASPGDGGGTTPTRTALTERVRRRPWAAAVAMAVVLAGGLGVERWLSARAAEAHRPRTAIAVLPFRDLSPDSSHAYFAGGLHEELLARLAKVASLTIVGRRSVGGYERTSKPLRQIAEELGVGSIVEGSVQVVDNRVVVVVELQDPKTDTQLWAGDYHRTLDDALTVQSDIAQQIVAQLGARLTSAEAEAMATAPTQNPQAYQFYLQGQDYLRRPGLLRQNFEIAGQLYERALGLDSTFAMAHAGLSLASHALYDLGYDHTPARLARARREADIALRLAPDLPQAHLAEGRARYLASGDYRHALEEFNRGLRTAPNDADLWFWVAVVNRSLGNWDSVTTAFDRARSLDPRNATLLQVMGDTYHLFHRYREAIEVYRQELALTPDVIQPRLSLAWSYVMWRGQLDTLRAVLRGLPIDADPGLGGGSVAANRLALVLLERQPDSAFSLLRTLHRDLGAGGFPITSTAYFLRRDTVAARAILDTVLVRFTAAERANPDDWGTHVQRGLVLVDLGRPAEALREARWMAQSVAYRNDRALDLDKLAWILLRSGEIDVGLAELERALAPPSLTTIPYLRLDARWDPVTRDPRFQAVLAKYADPGR